LTGLTPDTDTGVQGDDETTDTSPGITGFGIPNTFIQLYIVQLDNGLTMMGSANADGGGAFTITTPALVSGVYTFTATGTDQFGDISAQSYPLTITINPPQTPPTLTRFTPNSDAGLQGNFKTVDIPGVISGTGTPYTLIQLYDDDTVLIGNATPDGDGAFSFYKIALAPGVYSFTATGTDQFGDVSAQSDPLPITINPPPPVLLSLSSNTDTGDQGPYRTYSTYHNPVGIVGSGLPDSQIVLSQDKSNIGHYLVRDCPMTMATSR
jgi:hypothetical protein